MNVKKFLTCVVLSIIISLFFIPVLSYADDNNLNIEAPSAILMDNDTGKILYEKSESEKREPASTKKIMTAMLLLEHCP